MPTEEQKTVDIDTSGPGAEINVEEKKDESVVETEAPKQEQVETKQEEVKEEPREELKEGSEPEEKKDEEKLEDYSKGVQARIAKLTRKMREAERREKAAIDYAKKILFLNISCLPALKKFRDGTNVHVSLFKPEEWAHFRAARLKQNKNVDLNIVLYAYHKIDEEFRRLAYKITYFPTIVQLTED